MTALTEVETTLPGWFEAQVERTPDAVAVWCAGAGLTYAELNARANRLARRLLAAGAGPETVVALALPRSDRHVAALLAVLKVGATYMPVDPELPAERAALLLEDAAPVAVVTDPDLVGALPPPPRRAAPVIVLGDGALTDPAWSAADVGDAERRAPVRPETPAYLLHTSGSTGRPKGVVVGSAAVVNLLAWQLRDLPTGPGRTTVQFTALSFDVSIQEILGTLLAGARLAVPPDPVRRDPAELVAWMDDHGVTDLFAPMVVVDAVCRAALAQGRALPRLARIAQAGEAVALSDALRAFHRLVPGRRLHNHYGPTETHAATAHTLPADPAAWRDPVPIGRSVRGARLRVLDEALAPVPDGAAGELCVAGPGLARGYHGQPALTAERFVPDPFGPPGERMYRTGDRVRWRGDGLLDYLGRTDDQVKIRGVRVELGEVEATVRSVPEVDAVALAVRGEGGQRRLDAYLVPRPGATGVVARTRQVLRDRLPPALVPASFTLLDRLPLNANGKVDRNALPEPAPGGAAREDEGDQDGGPVHPDEAALRRLFAEVLEVDGVGRHDNFFDLGGHSLSAAELVGRVRTTLGTGAGAGIGVGVGEVLSHPTPARLARRLGAIPGRPLLRPRPRPDRLPASYAQQRLWIVDQLEGPTPRYNEHLALHLTGAPDAGALEEALADVVARHEPLRTVLPMDDDGGPHQQTLAVGEARPPLRQVDLAPGADVEAVLRKLLHRPFDLTADIPLRASLLRLGPDEHVLLVVAHHIACDAVSIGPLARDLAGAYDARRAGAPPAWPPLELRYSDHTLWQRELLGSDAAGPAGGIADQQAEFWAGALEGMPSVSPLPLDRPRPPERDGAGRRIDLATGLEVHRRLAELARSQRATVFMAVHAALVAVLRDRGAGDDVAVGTVVSGRGEGVLDDVVGFFVNTLVLRVDAGGDPPPVELLRRARDADLAALANQDLPFERVVEVVNPPRSMAHHPLVQVMLAFQVGAVEPPAMAGLDVAFAPFDPGVAKFDLSFVVTETFAADRSPAGLTGYLELATDVVDPATAEAIRDDLLAALGALARVDPCAASPFSGPGPRR